MGGGSFPIDILLFGMIAAFLVLRLRGILGRRTGFERPTDAPSNVVGLRPAAPVVDVSPEPAADARALPTPNSPAGRALIQMQSLDRTFDAGHFLAGGEAAFRIIVGAFAQGDRVMLRSLLTDATYASFDGAITGRETPGETQRSEIRSMPAVSIEEAGLVGTVAAITVRFVSDQIAETLDKEGKPVAGADAVTEITDLWTFERDLSVPGPAWLLSAARSG